MSSLAKPRNESMAMAFLKDAKSYLSKVRTFDEIYEGASVAAAAERWAKGSGLALDVVNTAVEARLRFERAMGAWYETLPRSPGRRTDLCPAGAGVAADTLKEHGVSSGRRSRAVALLRIPDDEFELHVESVKASKEELTTAGVLKLAKKSENRQSSEVSHAAALSHGIVQNLSELISAGAKFSTIYADPPWRYDNKATRSNVDSAAEYKGTMSIDEICAEPVSEIVTEQAHLHLWTTNAFLFDARKVMEAWGFEYKSCFVWVKPQMGIGNYWRVSHEFMLLGVRGGLRFADKGQKSWLEHNRGKHSQKPHIIRNTIQKVSPGPYLEMYGRHIVDGWTVYGNQIIGTAQREFTIQQDLF